MTSGQKKPPLDSMALSRASRFAMTAAGFAALFLTVCNNQPIFAVYLANHLGAPPALLGSLFGFMLATGTLQLVSVFIYRALPVRKTFWIAAHLVHRGLGLAVAASALLFSGGMPGIDAARLAALALGLSWVFMSGSTSGWLSWMADLVPEDVRGSFFLRRSAIFQTATVVWFFAASVALDFVSPGARSWVYAAIFGVGTLGGLTDIILHVWIPEPHFHRPAEALDLAEFLSPLRDRNFLRYSAGIGVAFFAVFVAAPFQAPFITDPRGIDAPNVWLGIMTVITILAWVAMAPLWGFVMDRYGRKPAVILGCLLVVGWSGFFFIDHHNYPYILPLVALSAGLFGPAFWEGSGQLMLTLAPVPRRVVYIAWFNTIVGLVGALGPLVGGQLNEFLSVGGSGAGIARALGVTGFAASQASALLFMAIAILVLRGVKEGGERPVAGLVGQIASAGLFRSYASLLDLRRHSGDPRVARALRRIDGDEGGMVLREVIDRLDDPLPEVREEAVRALGRIRSPESCEALVARLLDGHSDLRIEAARALGRLGDTRALPALEKALAGAGPALRAVCAGALGSLSGNAPGGSLAGLLEGEVDGEVRAAAALGASLGPQPRAEGGDELVDAVLVLYEGMVGSRNRALIGQYALGIGNLLGSPGGFAPFATGDEEAKAGRRRNLAEALGRRMARLLPGGESERIDLILGRIAVALESGSGPAALRAVLDLDGLALRLLFGPLRDSPDWPEAALRTDARLGAWSALAAAAHGRAEAMGEEASLLLALLGAYYLSSE